MKLFISHILMFLVVSSSLAFGLEWMADQGLRTLPNTKYEDWQELFKGEISSDIVILGSSRACANYDPQLIKEQTGLSTFNLGFNAASYNLQKTKYEWYLEQNATPKIIVQNIDLSHFSPSTQIPDPTQFLPFLKEKKVSGLISSFDASWGTLDRIPLVKYNTNLPFFVKGFQSFFGVKQSIFVSYDGFNPVSKEYAPDTYNLGRLKNKTSVLKEDVNNVIATAYTQASSSIVVLVWAPVLENRRELVLEEMTRLQNRLIEVAKSNESIYFLDYSADPISLVKNNFYDSFHLNEKGATLFSKMLGEDLKKLITR